MSVGKFLLPFLVFSFPLLGQSSSMPDKSFPLFGQKSPISDKGRDYLKMMNFCGPNMRVRPIESIKKDLKKFSEDDLTKIRSASDLSDEGWLGYTGALDNLRTQYGLDLDIQIIGDESAYRDFIMEKQEYIENLALKYDTEERAHESLERKANGYFLGDLSLPEFYEGNNCLLMGDVLRCLDNSHESTLTAFETDALNRIIRKPLVDFSPNFGSPSIVPAIDIDLTKLDPKSVKSFKKDTINYNLARRFAGRQCVIYQKELRCPLTRDEFERAQAFGYSLPYVVISEATYEAFGVKLGREDPWEKEMGRVQAIIALRNMNKKDRRWYSQGSTVGCQTGGCHANENLEINKVWTVSDRANSIKTGVIEYGSLGGIVGAGAGLVVDSLKRCKVPS